ncbi:MAG: tetratricopeptide repeat protein [Cellvibrionaceae bacterium]
MSLVNDMLKDLENRWPQAENLQGEDGVGGVRLMSQTAGNDESDIPKTLMSHSSSQLGIGPWALVLSGVIIFLLIIGGHYLWSRDQSVSSQQSLAPSVKVLVESEPQSEERADIESSAIMELEGDSGRNLARLLPATVVREDQVSENQVVAYRTPPTVDFLLDPEPAQSLKPIEERILDLMAEGDASLRLDRLTTPKEDNAYDRYMAVLALRPNHVEAQAGLDRVRTRYLEIVEIAIIKKYYYKVPELIRKAREIGVSQARIDSLVAGLPEKDGKPTKEVLQRIAEYEASRGLNRTEANSAPSEASPSSDEKINTQAGTPANTMVTASFSQRDRKVADEASKFIDSKQLQAAQLLLETFLESYPASVYAFREMFNLRIQQDNIAMAEAMIKDADHVPGEIFSYMVAQLLVYRKDYTGALRALNSQSPEMSQDLSYYALKAGVFHKLKQHQMAATTYRSLLRIDASNPTYWLGLAVTLDADGKSGALTAFQKVQQLSQGSESFLPYVRTRIGVLASNR